MSTLQKYSHNHLMAWVLATATLILAAAVFILSTSFQAAQESQVRKPNLLPQIPTAQATPLQPDCQALPECGYIRTHAIDQSLVGNGPVGQMSAPVLTPACDQLAECEYIRAHIQADAGQ
jgi:hypothetical protein